MFLRVAILRCGRCFYSTTNSVHLLRHNEDFHGQDTPVMVKAATSEVVIKAAEVTTTKAGKVTIKAVEAAVTPQRNPVPSRDYTRKPQATVMDETDMVTTDTTEGVSEADFLFDDETATEAEEVKEKVNKATNEVIKATPEVIPLLEIEAPKSDGSKKKCPDCDFSTDERYGITRHVRDVHGILAAAKCGLCKYEAEDDGFLLNLAKVRAGSLRVVHHYFLSLKLCSGIG